MPQTKIHELSQVGQSIWLDYISRPLLETGALQKWLNDGLRGMTSNPSIFNQSISQSKDYDEKISQLKAAGKNTFEIYDELTIRDIQDACDIFRPVYDVTKGLDGYVSLEINPQLANDTESSIKEGKRLYVKANRPNIMIKVPSTPAGFPVIEELLASGINVNVTLIFSLTQYESTANAFIAGLERLSKTQGDLSHMASVASVFVSRIDNVADDLLDKKIAVSSQKEKLAFLKGKTALANCQLVYAKSMEIFNGVRFRALAAKGARIQRVLWASTSTKNPAYSDVKYITELIAKDTVNTVPEKTLKAFVDHGITQVALKGGEAGGAGLVLMDLKNQGVDIDDICRKLLSDGVVAFEKSFTELIQSIEAKASQLAKK
ncbi:MAG: transaldolase [Candidatus Omnitrophica bacterium]|nr:transaldolase [Candidatus Omnitrophota bacterium]